jgi:hypothetical protein
MTKRKVKPPHHALNHPEYQKSLQTQLRPLIDEVIAQAEKAGWQVQAIDYAVMVIAAANLRMRAEEEQQ